VWLEQLSKAASRSPEGSVSVGYSKNSSQMEMLQADGLKEPVLSKRKGMCCTEGRPAQRLKRVFNGAA